MKNKHFFLLGVIVLLSLFALWGCPKKAQVTTAPETPKATEPVAEPAAPAEMKEEPAAKPATKEETMEHAAAGLQPDLL